MNAIIGGSPSTGSSLLRQMLNRHSQIYCGPETKLFAHPELALNWQGNKNSITANTGFARDIHPQRGFNLTGTEQQVSPEKLAELVHSASSLDEFVKAYFAVPIEFYGKDVWMEKTPSNALGFRAHLETFDDVLVIHMTRNPLDVIASLTSRGHNAVEAVGRWLLNTAHGLSIEGVQRSVLIKYEELVTDPRASTRSALEYLGMNYQPGIEDPGNPNMDETDQLPGWRSSELEAPNRLSVGRFYTLPEEKQEELLETLSVLKIREDYARDNDIKSTTPVEVAGALGYEVPQAIASNAVRRKLKAQLFRLSLGSLAIGHFYPLKERPLVVR